MKNKIIKRIEFTCDNFEYKLIKLKAKESGISRAEYCRKSALNQKVNYKLTQEEVSIYLMLQKYAVNFKNISNMFKARNPKLSNYCIETASEIRTHLKKLQL